MDMVTDMDTVTRVTGKKIVIDFVILFLNINSKNGDDRLGLNH